MVLAGVHLEVVLQDLEEFRRLWNSSGLDFGPEWHAVYGDLECAGGNQLTFDCVADEEEHHARVQLVVHGPLEGGGGGALAQVHERVERRQHADYDGQLGVTQYLGELPFPCGRRKVVSLDG